MLESMLEQFKSFYAMPGLTFTMVLMAIVLALVFAAIWLTIYRVWHFNKTWWIILLAASAILTWCAVAFIQIPLQMWTQEFFLNLLGMETYLGWLLLTGVPIILLSGLVQEGMKLVPVMAYWYYRKKQIDPLTGLYAGAIAGAGFGIFEAVWVHNMMFAGGWTWQMVSVYGTAALLGFWERLFSVGLHIAVSALAGYGWAKGMKWQYYLIAAGLHSLSNYAVILLNNGTLTTNQVELYIAVVAIGATVLAFLVMRNSIPPEVVQIEEAAAQNSGEFEATNDPVNPAPESREPPSDDIPKERNDG